LREESTTTRQERLTGNSEDALVVFQLGRVSRKRGIENTNERGEFIACVLADTQKMCLTIVHVRDERER
jgi:hypothetical protein